MKLIIAGSRSITSMATVEAAILWSGWRDQITKIVSGMAVAVDPVTRQPIKTVDVLAYDWAISQGIPAEKFYAKWRLYGYDAGFMRNAEMAAYADALLAVWDGRSGGTKDMIFRARERGLPVKVYSEAGL
jgi:hypothetical protein